MIYLVKTQVREGTYFKAGFTSNLANRLIPYFTHNPGVELLETVKTYRKTKHQLEVSIHQEILDRGYIFKVAPNGTTTEWFFVDKEHEAEFEAAGLAQFSSCKNRMIYKRK